MTIDKFEHLNALHKLLSTVKYSSDLNSEELDLFAGSPYVTEIYRRVREECIIHLQNQGRGDRVNEWLETTKFRLDSHTGQAIAKRIQNWPEHIVQNVAVFNRQQITKLAREYIEPLPVDAEELGKLVDLITKRVKE